MLHVLDNLSRELESTVESADSSLPIEDLFDIAESARTATERLVGLAVRSEPLVFRFLGFDREHVGLDAVLQRCVDAIELVVDTTSHLTRCEIDMRTADAEYTQWGGDSVCLQAALLIILIPLYFDARGPGAPLTLTLARIDGGYEIRLEREGVGVDSAALDAALATAAFSGLALCKDLVTIGAGGTFEISSDPVKGTVATIQLPENAPSQDDRLRLGFAWNMESLVGEDSGDPGRSQQNRPGGS